MLLKIVYLLTCRVLGLAVLALRGDRAKDAGLLVLRHQNAAAKSPLPTSTAVGSTEDPSWAA